MDFRLSLLEKNGLEVENSSTLLMKLSNLVIDSCIYE